MRASGIGAFLGLLLTGGVVQAQDAAPKTFIEAVKQVTSRPAYAHANWGLEVWSVDEGRPLYVMNGDKLFIPGSTTKLFTEGSVLYLLGPDYHFHTPLYRTGAVDKAGVLHGDLILVGSGDPNLSDRVQADGTLALRTRITPMAARIPIWWDATRSSCCMSWPRRRRRRGSSASRARCGWI